MGIIRLDAPFVEKLGSDLPVDFVVFYQQQLHLIEQAGRGVVRVVVADGAGLVAFAEGEAEVKPRPFSRVAFHPNLAALHFEQTLCNG